MIQYQVMQGDDKTRFGVYDTHRGCWQIPSYRFASRDEAQTKADYLNAQIDADREAGRQRDRDTLAWIKARS